MEEFHNQKCNTGTGDMYLDIYADENSTYIVIFTIVNTEKSACKLGALFQISLLQTLLMRMVKCGAEQCRVNVAIALLQITYNFHNGHHRTQNSSEHNDCIKSCASPCDT